MSQGKKVAFVTKPRILRAEEVFAYNTTPGKFVLKAVMVADKPKAADGVDNHRVFVAGEEIRTSFLIRIDIEKNEFETMNTIYKVVPECEVDTYRMCVPT